MTPFCIGEREVGFDHPPYIIGEACNNFNGDIDEAKRLVEAFAKSAVSAIKFQMRLQPDRLTPDEHHILAEFVRDHSGVDWLCSAFDEEGFQIVNDLDAPVHKIPSGQLTNYALIEAVASYGKPIILSTGMSTEQEVESAIKILGQSDVPFAVLQCTSIYPCPYHRINLGFLQRLYTPVYYSGGSVVGLSDHSPWIWPPIGAVALGARIIEKHITLDRTQPGPDQTSSLLPDDVPLMVAGIYATWMARGNEKRIFPEEVEKAEQHKYRPNHA